MFKDTGASAVGRLVGACRLFALESMLISGIFELQYYSFPNPFDKDVEPDFIDFSCSFLKSIPSNESIVKGSPGPLLQNSC